MKAIQIISQDLFDKVRSRFQNLEMGDETGAVTIDPSEARFFDFDFVNEGVNLGRVSISLNDVGSLKIYYSQGITENQDDPAKQLWYNFLKEMRLFSMRRLLRFDTRDIAKTNLDKNDFQHLATTQAPKEDPNMNMNESRWNQKSSKKTSRAVKGATEVIVRHHKSVDEMYPGARSQKKNIKAIYIQNRDGERFKYPFIHPAGAFAMAQHVDHGGVPHDPAGKAIVRMSEQIAQLQEFQRQVQHTSLHDDAMGITDRAVGRLNELKSTIEALSKRHHYESWVAELAGVDQGPELMELDPVTMETYKSKFTETNFKEDLASFFPLIHSIMQETNTVDLEDYVKEESDICPDCKEDPCKCDTAVKEDAFNEFAEWAEAVEQGKLTDDQIAELKQAMNELPNGELELGADGQTAWQFFSGLGLDDSDLEDKFKAASELDPSADPMEVLKMWAQESYPELLVALGLSGTGEEEPAPEAPPAAAPEAPPAVPEQPVAEGSAHGYNVVRYYEKTSDQKKLTNWLRKEAGLEKTAPLYFDDADLVYGDKTIVPNALVNTKLTFNDLLTAVARATGGQGKQNMDGVYREDEIAEGKEGNMVQEVAKIVKSFYNRDNPEVGPFRGGEGIVLDVKKSISEKFGEEAGEQAAQMAEQFMNKLTMEWQQRHGTPVNGDDGLARLKELVGNIKGRVEEMGEEKNPQHSHQYDTTMKHADNPSVQQRMAAHDIKPGIAGYRDRIDMLKDLERTGKLKNAQEESGPDKSQIPAYKRKEQGGDWKMSTKDLEKEKTNSPTSSAGLARKKAELGMSEELSSIMKLAGLGEGSGPKEKQKTPYRDINGSEYRAAADKQKDKMAKDKAAQPGKALLAKKK